jgi:hypothetical protein
MALGAVTPVNIDSAHVQQAGPIVVGDLKMAVINIVGEASYTTGGPSITAQQFGFNSTIYFGQAEVIASTGSNATSTALAVVPAAGGGSANLKAFTSANAEVASTTNVSGVTWQIIAFGI